MSNPYQQDALRRQGWPLASLIPTRSMAYHPVQLQRQLLARSERVKGIDFHPTEPWVSFTLQIGRGGC